MFVFGGWIDPCEVFDESSKVFSFLKNPETLRMNEYRVQDAISVSGKVLVFFSNSSIVAVYDLNLNVWTEEKFEATKKY